MSTDDARMHGGNTPGLVPGRGHQHREEPVRLDGPEPGAAAARPLDGPAHDLVRGLDRNDTGSDQDSALGGHVGTRSGTASTPDDETGAAS